MINKGSEWRKWDLHIHTPKTLCSEYGGDTPEIWDKFINELERLALEKNIKVIGINDYLFLDGYKKVLEYKKNGRLSSVELILPVIEFRLKEFVGSKELGRINYHIIFADDSLLNIEQIETHFLSGFKGKANLNVDNPEGFTWGGVITRESLIDLGNHIIEQTPIEKKTSMKPIDVGFNNINFELSKIEEILGEGSEPNLFLKGKYFKAIGKAEWEDFRWDGSPMEKKNIINNTHIIFSASPTTEKANKGKKSLQDNNVNSRLLHCSDSHGFAKDVKKTNSKELGHCNTWIKSQPTFEGLKQIMFEPEERVRIQKEKPESDKLENLIIEKVSIISDNKKFTPFDIYFNKNLNVIIGGKSSGKSILLYNIAKTLYENTNNSILKYKDSEDDFKEKDLYNLRTDDSLFDFQVQNYLGINQSVKRENGKSSILPSIKYIPQNHLSNLVDKSKKNSSILKEYIRNLILENNDSQKDYQDFLEELRNNDKIRENDINEYFTYKKELADKQGELQQKGDKESIKKTIVALELKIKEISKQMSDEQTKEYNELNIGHSKKELLRNSLINDFEKVIAFLKSTEITLNELQSKQNLLLENIELPEIQEEFKSRLSFVKNMILENEKLLKLYQKDDDGNFIITENNLFEEKTSKNNLEITSYREKLEPFNKLFENQKQVEGFQKTISLEKVKLSEIEQIEKEIKNINETAVNRKEKIFKDVRNNREKYNVLIEKFKPRIESIKQEDLELDIQSKIFFNFPKYRKSILSISHGNSRHYDNFEILKSDKKALQQYDFEKYINDLKLIFDSIENNNYTLLKGVSKKDAIKKMLDDYFFDHWDITYKADTIHKMSTGKASLVLLKVMIKLSSVKGPILIDQPEDNLDNRSVTNELVEYLKEKKRERQIIIVTHNANIVVNADAENIIVANQRGQTSDDKLGSPYLFDYTNGAIEDSYPVNIEEKDLLKSMGIREHVAEIVEGGKDAFIKRENKYGFV
jgi:energy-coupling factor transporter ATP-binding protein EcfA2